MSKTLLQPVLYKMPGATLWIQQRQKQYFDQGTRRRSDLLNGENVRIRQDNKWQPATVIKKHDQLRAYTGKTASGQVYRRNRRQLLKTREIPVPETTDDTTSEYPGTRHFIKCGSSQPYSTMFHCSRKSKSNGRTYSFHKQPCKNNTAWKTCQGDKALYVLTGKLTITRLSEGMLWTEI